jgi:hypothetical protein
MEMVGSLHAFVVIPVEKSSLARIVYESGWLPRAGLAVTEEREISLSVPGIEFRLLYRLACGQVNVPTELNSGPFCFLSLFLRISVNTLMFVYC